MSQGWGRPATQRPGLPASHLSWSDMARCDNTASNHHMSMEALKWLQLPEMFDCHISNMTSTNSTPERQDHTVKRGRRSSVSRLQQFGLQLQENGIAYEEKKWKRVFFFWVNQICYLSDFVKIGFNLSELCNTMFCKKIQNGRETVRNGLNLYWFVLNQGIQEKGTVQGPVSWSKKTLTLTNNQTLDRRLNSSFAPSCLVLEKFNSYKGI